MTMNEEVFRKPDSNNNILKTWHLNMAHFFYENKKNKSNNNISMYVRERYSNN